MSRKLWWGNGVGWRRNRRSLRSCGQPPGHEEALRSLSSWSVVKQYELLGASMCIHTIPYWSILFPDDIPTDCTTMRHMLKIYRGYMMLMDTLHCGLSLVLLQEEARVVQQQENSLNAATAEVIGLGLGAEVIGLPLYLDLLWNFCQPSCYFMLFHVISCYFMFCFAWDTFVSWLWLCFPVISDGVNKIMINWYKLVNMFIKTTGTEGSSEIKLPTYWKMQQVSPTSQHRNSREKIRKNTWRSETS